MGRLRVELSWKGHHMAFNVWVSSDARKDGGHPGQGKFKSRSFCAPTVGFWHCMRASEHTVDTKLAGGEPRR